MMQEQCRRKNLLNLRLVSDISNILIIKTAIYYTYSEKDHV